MISPTIPAISCARCAAPKSPDVAEQNNDALTALRTRREIIDLLPPTSAPFNAAALCGIHVPMPA